MSLARALDLSKSFDGKKILSAIDFEISHGEIIGVLGPSGCGKSTLLRIIAGLEAADSGAIEMEGEDQTWAPPGTRDIAMVFQSLALYPHMTARQNMALPLRVRRMTRPQRLATPLRRLLPASIMANARARERSIAEAVEHLADKLEIRELLDRLPAKMSGGQRQRVAIGRALIRDCRLLLLDEPLSSLDAKMREQARGEIVQILRSFGIACIYVTHDQSEAFAISDRIAVMFGGRIAQFDAPSAIYRAPATLDVARFVGSPTINCLKARIETPIRVRAGDITVAAALPCPVASEVTMAVRPEHISVRPASAGGSAWTIQRFEDHGNDGLIHLENAGRQPLVVRTTDIGRWRRGEEVTVEIANALFFDKTGGLLQAKPVRVPQVAAHV